MLAIIAPGQGAQTPGFLSPWLEDGALRDLLENFSEGIELDLIKLGTVSDGDEIRNTANAQPLIVAAGLLGMNALGKNFAFSATAGHSVGEITSAAIAGVISFNDAMALVRERGLLMSVAAEQSKSGMSAILGGEPAEVLAAIESFGLIAANNNGAGQIVAAGDLLALNALSENPPAGARVRPLAVAGAFHTHFMRPALSHLEGFAQSLHIMAPTIPILSNKDGEVLAYGGEVIDRIVNQIISPVRWDLCMETLVALGVTAVIELPPAGTLVGLLKRAAPSIETVALKTPADLEAAWDLALRHGGKIETL